MASKYIPFFSLQLLHNYFADNGCDVVQVTPDANTRALMNNLNIIWKQVDNMVYFYILNDPLYPSCPLVYPYSTDVFRFSLSVTDPLFFNYTNLYGWGESNNDLYYFSNQAGNYSGSPLETYLSAPIDSSGVGLYTKGALLNSQGLGTIYEATQYNPTSVPPGLDNSYSFIPSGGPVYPDATHVEADYLWYNRGSNQSFVSVNDVIQVAGFSYNFSIPGNTLTSTNASINAYNIAQNQYNILVTNPPVYQNYGSQVPTSCNVNLQGLATGLYQINVNGFTQNLLVDNTGQLTNGIGVIEIYATPNFTNTGGDDPYRLIAGNTLFNSPLLQPTYTIQFANSLVYWQYIPAVVPHGSTANLNSVSFGNIPFFNFSDLGPGYVTFDSARQGSSLLMIPLVEAMPVSPYEFVYPQATGPPADGNYSLPLAQVTQFQMLPQKLGSGSGSPPLFSPDIVYDVGAGSGSGLVSVSGTLGATGLVYQLLVSQNYLNIF